MSPIILYNSKIMKMVNNYHLKRHAKKKTSRDDLFRGYAAMTIFPFILVDGSDMDEETLRHETIHIWQYVETLVIGFLLIYAWDYLYSRLVYKMDHSDAYDNIRFEQEAYGFQTDHEYKYSRRPFAWTTFKLWRRRNW